MKLIVRLVCFMLLLISFSSTGYGQVKINTTNIITQLFSLDSCTFANACKFYAGKHYPLLQDTTVNAAGNTITTYRYQVNGKTELYTLAAINGRMMTAGYITTQAAERDKIIDLITGMGFTLSRTPKVDATKTVYKKKHLRFCRRGTNCRAA